MHAEYALLALPVVALLQVYLSYIIQSKYFQSTCSSGSNFRSGTRRTRLLLAIWSLLAPPLFMDWDHLYRQGEYSTTITECWQRSKKVLFLHHLITLLGNVVLVLAFIPFMLQTNSNATAAAFATTLGTGMGVAVVGQALNIGLGFIYFKTCHPWARLLKAELSKKKKSTDVAKNTDPKFNRPIRSKSEPILKATNLESISMRRSKSEPNLVEGQIPTLMAEFMEAENLSPNVVYCTHL